MGTEQESQEAKKQKKDDVEAKKAEAESQRQACQMVFMNGEMVFSGNVASKKVEDLWDICWALAGKNDGTKDMLLTMIKTCLTNPAVQNSMKFLGLYFGHCPAAAATTDENGHVPMLPICHPDLPAASAAASTLASTLHLPAMPVLPPPSYYHSAPMPPLPLIASPAFQLYFPMQTTTQLHPNDIPSSVSVHSQQPNFSTI